MTVLRIIVLTCLVSGCAAVMERTVTEKASFELNCPNEDISVVKLGDRSYGAVGCDKRITFLVQGQCTGAADCRAVKEAYEPTD